MTHFCVLFKYTQRLLLEKKAGWAAPSFIAPSLHPPSTPSASLIRLNTLQQRFRGVKGTNQCRQRLEISGWKPKHPPLQDCNSQQGSGALVAHPGTLRRRLLLRCFHRWDDYFHWYLVYRYPKSTPSFEQAGLKQDRLSNYLFTSEPTEHHPRSRKLMRRWLQL